MPNPIKIQVVEPFDDAFEVSAKELAEVNGLDYLEARGFLETLVKLKACQVGKPRKIEGAKGKPTKIYLLPTCMQVTCYEQVKGAA